MEQEQRSLMMTGDFFKRIIITKDTPAPHYNENGVLIMNIYDFLLDDNSLENWKYEIDPNSSGGWGGDQPFRDGGKKLSVWIPYSHSAYYGEYLS